MFFSDMSLTYHLSLYCKSQYAKVNGIEDIKCFFRERKNILRQAQIQTYKATDVKKCSLIH